ncbi:MAG: 30S ribosomal protein S12 methylthiotransferase RimO [Saprospiraceae bacterium]
MKTKKLTKDLVSIITLGCSKNIVDSENLITQLRFNDFEVMHDRDEKANIVVVNTCGFIDLAKQESIDTILHYADQKAKGNIEKLYVTGCLSQRYKDELEIEIPEVDAYFGTLELPGLLQRFEVDYRQELIGSRQISTLSHYAYLKISEGCNRTCTFCAIPLMRGKHVSRTMEDLVAEAKNLVKQGVKEIMLIAQELTYYGLDLYKERKLADLLNALCEVEGLEWIRLHYAYPSKFPMEIFDVMAAQPKICKYLDIPLQHGSNAVLARMKRQITRPETEALIQEARKIVPGIAIRTTMLVGFPGESEEEFDEMLQFVERMKFERLGVFQYSHEEDTAAYLLVDDVSPELKASRAQQLMEIQRKISEEKNILKIGTIQKVLFDRKEGGYFIGRTESDSPDVDNEVMVDASKHYVRIGDFAMIMIQDATEFDLIGEPIQLN